MVVLEVAMVDIVVKDLLKLVMVVSVDTEVMVDTEGLVVMEDMDSEEAMVDTVVRDLLKLDTVDMEVELVDTEDLVVMEERV